MSQPKSNEGSAKWSQGTTLCGLCGQSFTLNHNFFCPAILKTLDSVESETAANAPPEHVHEHVIPVEWKHTYSHAVIDEVTRAAKRGVVVPTNETYVTKLRCACGDERER